MLKALRVYLELDMYAGFTLHTTATLEAGRARLPILADLIHVSIKNLYRDTLTD